MKLTLLLPSFAILCTSSVGASSLVRSSSGAGQRALRSKSSKATKTTAKSSKASRVIPTEDVKVYQADLGYHGSFQMEIGPDGRALFSVDLIGLGPLRDAGETSLSWHLHSGKIGEGDTFNENGAEACAPGFTAGHYDPYLGCGGASTAALCVATNATECCLEKPASNYCTSGNVATCEVGDLSGLYGSVDIIEADMEVVANATILPEDGGYCPGCRNDFAPEATNTDGSALYNTWASIVFHKSGGARVLCADVELIN